MSIFDYVDTNFTHSALLFYLLYIYLLCSAVILCVRACVRACMSVCPYALSPFGLRIFPYRQYIIRNIVLLAFWRYSQVQDRNGGWGEMYKNV